jgi:two-component system response regulator RstA
LASPPGEEDDRSHGLESGADDFLPTPFSPRALLAQIRAVVRRVRGQAGPVQATVTVGDLSLDPGTRTAPLAGRAVDPTSYEFSLLYTLASSAGRVLSSERASRRQCRGVVECARTMVLLEDVPRRSPR